MILTLRNLGKKMLLTSTEEEVGANKWKAGEGLPKDRSWHIPKVFLEASTGLIRTWLMHFVSGRR